MVNPQATLAELLAEGQQILSDRHNQQARAALDAQRKAEVALKASWQELIELADRELGIVLGEISTTPPESFAHRKLDSAWHFRPRPFQQGWIEAEFIFSMGRWQIGSRPWTVPTSYMANSVNGLWEVQGKEFADPDTLAEAVALCQIAGSSWKKAETECSRRNKGISLPPGATS